ncbi:4-hydroxybenzoate 3-monooxygenase [Pseudoroseicyclus tamaricis]|uniref:4-hydroxybenzoate 3-monooxygenase n=1 Tax=Pseudoroseicyclus tamaricis TaxID=2705421 RepID=A0A6B2K670_9RHOB|nr:4-hydroxybenzoate 3-monooxygenase [Pseudoroseicyclus tamaricis]NDV02346.1 4-hydroxybenzoate 3-monooxygenase [Pseudoroseicyclus tamaricis]
MRTQVCIIGGGPAGLLLGQLLHREGIDTILLERRTEAHVLSRIRAGVLERGFIGLMHEAGVADRLEREGERHGGVVIGAGAEMIRLDLAGLTGHGVTVYGQTEVTRDLYGARHGAGLPTLFEVDEVAIGGLEGAAAEISFLHEGERKTITCDYVAGCDGFHGPSRQAIPEERRREVEKVFPFGWLGILSETPPVHEELIYATSDAGFALCSMRSQSLSRYYVQVPMSERVEEWSDDRFWEALRARIPAEAAERLVTGPSIEKSIAPLRSFVCEPMQWGRLFLCGDAAHIVPPTGAKGLNTAASDVHYLWQALTARYAEGDEGVLGTYSERALARVWKTQRFSWWMTQLLHHFPEQTPYDRRVQEAELAFLKESEAAQRALAENYVGLPY